MSNNLTLSCVKDYYHFSVNDFVRNERFQAWVWKPTEENNAFWRQWLAIHPDKAATVEEARFILKNLQISPYSLPAGEVDELWKKIHQRENVVASIHRKSRRLSFALAGAIAAAIALLIVILWPAMDSVTVRTHFGETRTIVLPDQSTVMLNSNSSITYSPDWTTTEVREIHLTGEAYFDVVHKSNDQPFRVRVDEGVAVDVLGTTFNVYHRTKETKVVLKTGSIRLTMENKQRHSERVMMQPGELVEVRNNSYVKRKVDADGFVAWTENKLVLNETSLLEMIRMLNENFGLKVEVKNSRLLNETISGSMPMPDSTHAVEQIARAFRLQVESRDGVYLLSDLRE